MADTSAVEVVVAQLSDLARLRREIRQLAAATGFPEGDVVLAVGELASNSLLYTDGCCRVRGWHPTPAGALRIEVADSGPSHLPAVVRAAPTAAGGRGLCIVDHVVSRWGVHIHDGIGKTVWFEIDPPGH